MSKNLIWKVILIVVLVLLAGWTLYPPEKTLKPGIDLAGGTSLIYEIDAQGLKEAEKKGLAQRMITVLRRRIDPANIQNLIWRPQGNTRFEIQMPLASVESRLKRQAYEEALTNLLAENVNPAKILRCLQKPVEERLRDFNDVAQGDPNRIEILRSLAEVYDQRSELQSNRDQLGAEIRVVEDKISQAGLDLDQIKLNRGDWARLGEQELRDAIKESPGFEDNVDLVAGYIKSYADWSEVVRQLTDTETGRNVQYDKAKRDIDKLNLSSDQMNFVLEMSGTSERKKGIEQLKAEFPDRAGKIDRVVATFDEYRPDRGRLDDPKDLQRMLKGAGILEFRVLPTQGHPDVDMDEMARYVELLKEKGPRYASDSKFMWCEIEKAEQWRARDVEERPTIVAPFGDKFYVLASNQQDETILHTAGTKQWKLEKAEPSRDRMGRRAIAFLIDERGGKLFSNVSSKNLGRPLTILLDGLAISAPRVQDRLYRQNIITGSFSETEVGDMVDKLNAGSLPARLIEQPISVKTIGPSIGTDNRDQGIKAGFIGLFAVVFCMLVYYTVAGSVADVALLMNILFVLAIMAGLRATFTLPGIAGIILTIGMSVDANVLIFERIREEQQRGSSLRIAITNGYQRAFRAIFDANLTTFITAMILYGVASEEIKGFAIVLMLGIASSMFTALFVTRVFFDFLLGRRIIKNHLSMLRLIHNPNVNWMRLRPVFFLISAVLVVGGLFVFFTRDDAKNNKYDIEFTGGTSATLNLKQGVTLSRQQVQDRICEVGEELGNSALQTANVTSVGKSGRQFEVTTTEINKVSVVITMPQTGQRTTVDMTAAISGAEEQFAGRLSNLFVTQDVNNPAQFIMATSQMNQSLIMNVLTTAFPDANMSQPEVDEVVNNAILTAFADELEIQQNLRPQVVSQERISDELVDSYPELSDYLNGVRITCEIERAAAAGEITQRFKDLLFKPEARELTRYSYEILDSELNPFADPNRPVKSFVYVSVEPEAGFRVLSEDEWTRFVENETVKVLAAASLETSLPQVRQFDPSVGAEQKTWALIAIVLSLIAIVAYIWVRFGNVRYGFAAILALVHDVSITLGAVTVCTYIAATPIGEKLLIGDFKINLAIIAAFLTLIGYSLNDTIVVFDRIRENRRKAQINPQIINNSINQTVSRTIMTSFTTFVVVLIMYIFGGVNLRGFTFAIGFGVIVGTYSSIAIAAPILLLGAGAGTKKSTAKSKKK